MFMEMTTTITHRIHVGDGGVEGVDHSVAIEGGDFAEAAGVTAAMIVVKAGLNAALNSVESSNPTIVHEVEGEEESD